MKFAFLAIVALLVVVAGAYSFSNQSKLDTLTNKVAKTQPTNTPSGVMNNDSMAAGGSSHLDTKGVYSILYPNDYAIDTQDNGRYTRIFKRGATQKGQTEMYDGVIIVFETIELKGKPLSQWVDDNIKTSTADGTIKIIEPKKNITINTYPGFTYKTRSLGEAKYYVLQKNSTSPYAVVITTSVSDPENIGFQKQVDQILSSMTLLK
jgi:hypothetical protein